MQKKKKKSQAVWVKPKLGSLVLFFLLNTCYEEKQAGRKGETRQRQTLIKGNVSLAHTEIFYFHLEDVTKAKQWQSGGRLCTEPRRKKQRCHSPSPAPSTCTTGRCCR